MPLLPLPPVAYDACDKQASRVSSLSLVRYRTNDYSAPVAYGYRDVLVRGYVDAVVISCGTEGHRQPSQIIRTRRLRLRPHPLPAALGGGNRAPWLRPLRCRAGLCPMSSGRCAGCWSPAWDGGANREFVQVLRLLETFSQLEVHAAVKDAIHLGSLSFDAVKHLVLCRLEGRPPRLDLELYPYLPRVRVSTTSARDYMTLLAGRAA